ncbi:MAG: hypothetical protein Q8L27_04735 [archaeon]|nr:hypothetical protein [archaeon]
MSQSKEKKFRKAVRMEAKLFYNELLRKKVWWIPKKLYEKFLNKILGI